MQSGHIPTLIVGLTTAVYWGAVLRMVVRVSRRTRQPRRVLVPTQWRERLMWVVWGPLVCAWIAVPLWTATLPVHWSPMTLPAVAVENPWLIALRWVAAAAGLACLLLSLRCWQHMGRHWRMAVDPDQVAPLLTDGPFAVVRHPIYALSILLMLCTVVIVPTSPIALLAAIHIALMHGKARNEERFLLARHGAAYADYGRRTGRFVPRRRRDQTEDLAQGSVMHPLGPPTCSPVRLNHLQQAMLHWERIHPYIAVHAVRLRGPADVAALRSAARDVCTEAGVGVLHVDPRAQTLTYHALREVSIRELPATPTPDEALCRVLTDEINRPFPAGPHHPLRWSAFDAADSSGHYIVLAYHHLIADASSIERLLAAILRRYRGRPARADEPRVAADALAASAWLRAGIAREGRVRSVRRALQFFRRVHYSHRLKEAKPGTDRTEVLVRTAPDGLLEGLATACHARSVRVGDMYLTALCAAIAQCTREVRARHAHEEFALGEILSLRRGSPAHVARHFGVALAQSVLLPGDPETALDELLLRIAAARRQRETAEQAATLNACFLLARTLWPLLLKPNHRRTYRKAFPIAAGLSAFNIDATLFTDLAGDLTRYVRASPTGPAVPLVLAPTVFGGRLELALIHRDVQRGCGPPAALFDRVCEQLSELATARDVRASGPVAAGAGVEVTS